LKSWFFVSSSFFFEKANGVVDPKAREELERLTKDVHAAVKSLEDALSGKITGGLGEVDDAAAVAKYIGDLEQELRRLQELQEHLRRNPNDKKAQEV